MPPTISPLGPRARMATSPRRGIIATGPLNMMTGYATTRPATGGGPAGPGPAAGRCPADGGPLGEGGGPLGEGGGPLAGGGPLGGAGPLGGGDPMFRGGNGYALCVK